MEPKEDMSGIAIVFSKIDYVEGISAKTIDKCIDWNRNIIGMLLEEGFNVNFAVLDESGSIVMMIDSVQSEYYLRRVIEAK